MASLAGDEHQRLSMGNALEMLSMACMAPEMLSMACMALAMLSMACMPSMAHAAMHAMKLERLVAAADDEVSCAIAWCGGGRPPVSREAIHRTSSRTPQSVEELVCVVVSDSAPGIDVWGVVCAHARARVECCA